MLIACLKCIMVSLKVITCNVRGISDKIKRKQVFLFCKSKKADVVFIQESHATKKCEKFWTAEWGGKAYYSNGESNARGVIMLLSKELSKNVIKRHGRKTFVSNFEN